MRLIDADALLNELDRLDLDYGAMGGVAECIAITEHAPTIKPSEDTKSCGVSADRQTDQNVADVPIGDLVSRDEVLALINKAMYNTDNKEIQDYLFCGLRRDVHNLPTIEPSGDLISRQDAIEVVRSAISEKWLLREAIIIDIETLPSAEQVTIKQKNVEISTDKGDKSTMSQPNGKLDLISRQEAIKVVTNLCVDGYKAKVDGYFIPLTDALINTLSALPSADRPITKDTQCQEKNDHSGEVTEMVDLIGREDAIDVGNKIVEKLSLSFVDCEPLKCWAKELFEALPSADAKQNVIRSRTLMPTKDFNEWAKRIREVNPNVVVIPCDAEVVSADRPRGEWKTNNTYKGLIFCDECGMPFKDSLMPKNYCPNCGADMRRDEE